MKTIVSFKNIDPVEEVHERAEKKAEKVSKFLKDANTLNYTFHKENRSYNVDIIVQSPGHTFKASVESTDFVLGIDEGIEKIINQIKKYKEKNEPSRNSNY